MSDRVLVVGAGPTGLALSCELWRRGVPARTVATAGGPSTTSKALGVQPRTLEVLDAMGIAERFVAAGRPIHGMNAYSDGQRIVHVEMHDIDSPYPFVLAVPQSETERILEARLVELGGRVERGVTLTALAQDGEGVTATLSRGGGAEAETARAAWLVGCDGAHSAVRHALGLPFEGTAYEESFVLADVKIEWGLPADEMHAFLAPAGAAAVFPLPGAGRWRLVAETTGAPSEGAPNTPPNAPPTLEELERLLRERGAPEAKLSDVAWATPFRIHRRMVPRYRVDRVFLAGDAAHVHSPVGGQGMNTGIQDAMNLAWKLALADTGAARAEILDSYDAERRPVAAATLSGTDLATRVVTLRSPVAREARDRLAGLLTSLDVVQKRVLAQASEIAIGYRASPIVDEHRAPVARATVGKRVGEGPTLGDWMGFGGAPHPGDRAPDVEIEEGKRLFALFRHPRHTLLLFDGSAPTPEGYENLATIARRVRERWGAHIECWIVVPLGAKPAALANEERVLLDPKGALHRRYGGGSECSYLVRPDGYVGFRSQPASRRALEDHCDGIFRAGGGAGVG